MLHAFAAAPLVLSTVMVAAISVAIVAIAICLIKVRMRWIVATVAPLIVAIVAYQLPQLQGSQHDPTAYFLIAL
jgi:thiamine transporter ThiT